MRLLAPFLIALMISSCAIVPPKVTTCIQNTNTQELHCSKAGDETVFRIPYKVSHRFICTSPDDYEAILNYIDEVLEKAEIRTKALIEPMMESLGGSVEDSE